MINKITKYLVWWYIKAPVFIILQRVRYQTCVTRWAIANFTVQKCCTCGHMSHEERNINTSKIIKYVILFGDWLFSYLTLTLSCFYLRCLGLRLGLRWQSKICKVEFCALCVRSEKVRVQEREGLWVWGVCVDTHVVMPISIKRCVN